MDFAKEVMHELAEMKKTGLQVPEGAFELAKDEHAMAEYENMSTSECADLLIELAECSQ